MIKTHIDENTEDDIKNTGSNNVVGFNLVCGTSPKNGLRGTIPGIRGCVEGKVLDLSEVNSLLVVDLDYFIDHKEEVVDIVTDQIKRRDNR